MSEQLIVDNSNEMKEFRDLAHQPRHPLLRVAAQFFSWVFHPLFVPVYLIAFLIWAQPYFFAGFTNGSKGILLIRFFVMYTFFPLVTVALLKGLGFLDSFFLKTQRDRIIPYIACEIYYFWMAYTLRHEPEFPHEIVQLSIGIFISASLGLLLNISMKVSMHAIAMGTMVAFVGLLAFTQAVNYTLYFSLALLLAGLVCTARFVVSDHTQKEIYTGFLLGILSLVLGVWADGFLP